MVGGMLPRAEATKGAWGGWVVEGGVVVKLKTVLIRMASAYASATPGGRSWSTL